MHADWRYPRFLRRLQTAAIDGIILTIVFMSTLFIVSNLGFMGREAILITGIMVLLWEPLFMALTGGTIGHHILGLRVVNYSTGKNINLFAGIIRFIIKMILGWASIVFIFLTRYHQALHDGAARSVVILKAPSTKPDYEALQARQTELPGYKYPSVMLRGIMMVLYNIALIYVMGYGSMEMLPTECLSYGECSSSQELILTLWQLLWLVGVITIIILCWKGRLFGCRRRRRRIYTHDQ